MDSDFRGGPTPRRKPKIVKPLDASDKPNIHELIAREGHKLDSVESDASGPEAIEAESFVNSRSENSPLEAEPNKVDEVIELTDDEPDSSRNSSESKGHKSKLAWLSLRFGKKTRLILLACGVLLVLASALVAYELNKYNTVKPLTVNNVKIAPKPVIYYSPLSGEAVTKAQSEIPVTGVMIENSLPARPQSGLSQAGIVYEAIAEAGITRFLALYQANEPTNIGPVRSARPYFVSWALGYNAAYAHVGGSPDGLNDIKAWGVKDLDQFYAGSAYHRIDTRYAPHNVYTSMADLLALEASRGWSQQSGFDGFARKADDPAKTPTATNITMNISSPDYLVNYVYNAKDNAYERFLGGQPHLDANTNQQIEPKVVVALIIPYSFGPLDSSGAYYSVYNNVGSGPAYVFQDGTVTQATWQKTSNSASLHLLDSAGKDLPLNRGQTWITALGDASLLSYK